MKVINETKSNTGGTEPKAGCVCASGWKNTRGSWNPWFSCHCNCISGNDANKKAKNAQYIEQIENNKTGVKG